MEARLEADNYICDGLFGPLPKPYIMPAGSIAGFKVP